MFLFGLLSISISIVLSFIFMLTGHASVDASGTIY
jgi:hypothetical protein